jgi:type II secretory pathway component HofQ
VIVGKGVHSRVAVDIKDVPAHEALTIMAKSGGHQLVSVPVQDGPPTYLVLAARIRAPALPAAGAASSISLDLQDLPLSQATAILAKLGGFDVTVARGADIRVSLTLGGVSALTALHLLAAANGYVVERDRTSRDERYLLVPVE